jgi:hypothetical protein
MATSVAALLEAFRLARARATEAAVTRAVPFLLSVAIGVGTIMIFVSAIAPCLD